MKAIRARREIHLSPGPIARWSRTARHLGRAGFRSTGGTIVSRLSIPERSFSFARRKYARLRREAFDRVTRDARILGIVGDDVRLTEIDDAALEAWRQSWRGRHPSGDGGWNWERIVRPLHRRPSAFHVAIWSGDRLCGLAAGRMSAKRRDDVRHTISVHYMEADPNPARPLVGLITFLVIRSAEAYARRLGASRIRLVEPLRGVLHLYLNFGFMVAWKGKKPVYCEKGIER